LDRSEGRKKALLFEKRSKNFCKLSTGNLQEFSMLFPISVSSKSRCAGHALPQAVAAVV
jgi:hypothetical protein